MEETYGPISLGKSYTKENIVYVPVDVFSVLAEKTGTKAEYSLKGKKMAVTVNQTPKTQKDDGSADKHDQEDPGSEKTPVAEALDLSKATSADFIRRTNGQFEAYTELGLAAALEECMKANGNREDHADDLNFVEAKVEVKNDINVSHEITSLGYIVIGNGAAITIENSGLVQASVDILEGCSVIVNDGGKFWTTQGGEECIRNYGTVVINKGSEMKSMFGGTINNFNKLEHNGIFYCGCVRFEGNTVIWFRNRDGKVTGSGEAVV